MSEELKDQTQLSKEETQPRSEEERVYQALETARQTVKPIVKRLIESELVDDELLNLRLKK
jgi:hypothetical protein